MVGSDDTVPTVPDSLQRQIAALRELPVGEREGALGELCRQHPAQADQLHALFHLQGLAVAETRPERIGPYRVLDILGEGGMGTVYLAEQKEPVRRRVAVKVIKPGMDSEVVLRRFEAERQALALMEHSNIAKVYDAGATGSGQPYFVMEYVRGVPVTEHCDQFRLGIEERLGLFRQICAGVQHAHQKGIMHRDLKPSNVLVTFQDGKAIPKIIDFGLARATDHSLVQATIYTALGQIVGTPEYMSPEQAGLGRQDVDMRTDVYSLGVILYELLVGGLPFDRTDRAALLEIQRRIREDEPAKPSTRLLAQGEGVQQAVHNRRTDTRSLVRRLRVDLDWVVMKALEKDRSRRYETPAALSDDLLRHLRNEPVLAGPPSAAYRVKKFVRRYKGQVIAAAAVLLTLVAGIAGTTSFMLEAERRAEAEAAAHRAEAEARRGEAVARGELEEALADFNLLANVVKLRVARQAEAELYPAWPENVDAMREWLVGRAEPLERALADLERTLDELRARALEPTEEELESWRQEHPRFSELEGLRSRHAALERAHRVRMGLASDETVTLDASVPGEVTELNGFAWRMVEPDRERFGYEADGLSLARLAWEKLQAGAEPRLRPPVADTLAWALFANGLDEEAVAMSEAALAAAPPEEKEEYQRDLDRMRASITAAQGKEGAEILANLALEIELLESELSGRRQWRFEDEADQFLHDALATLVQDIEEFVDPDTGPLPRVRDSMAWAQKVRGISVTTHGAKWEEARLAIRSADGRTASELYAFDPLDLQPQTGLVPIGMNPTTGLWEFYHLRSAADPDVIPRHDEQGNIEVTPATGIIFVLIPGGIFRMGAQKEDPNGPNYDPFAEQNRVRRVKLEPYFLARHEMTQAQWERLSGGEKPSFYGVGFKPQGMGGYAVTPAHPVEQVSWYLCQELLTRHGLRFPYAAEWEYACRGGTTTPWYTGTDVLSLAGHANVLDDTGAAAVPGWGPSDGFDDGFVVHAPVGSFLPNGFGLFDMHGNVFEWCEDGSAEHRHYRGGSFMFPGRFARCALGDNNSPSFPNNVTGIRPAREIRQP